MQVTRMALRDVPANPDNPRVIRDEKFKKLVQSLRDFPQMLELRPIVVNAQRIVLGGNMRLKACEAAGLLEVPVIIADALTPEQEREFIIKDNVSFGEWDWDILANQWELDTLIEWGLDLPQFDELDSEDEEDNPYSINIAAPVYKPTKEQPALRELYNTQKADALVASINGAAIPDDVKAFLRAAAARHIVFDYHNVAEYYAHAPSDIQELMEASALVIIDFDKAIEHGFVKLTTKLSAMFGEEYDEAK